ncbi:MAG: hypothetical protein Ct9H90mP13_11980 [Pseudomonadota bacterium]|nr:MAG: hypothetical protein Ct9H90mP13_11980 [Pseudomonadota bacterium]
MKRKKPEMNNYLKKIMTLVPVLMIIACSTTGDQSQSVIDGFSENLVNEGANHYRVVYEGSQWINKSDAEAQRVVDYSLLRSAELSLENDFPFFVILSNDSENREIIRDDPACNFKNKKAINQRKCMRYKSIGDLTSAFLKDPLEVETGTNIIKDGDYEGKALFSSVSVYKVITRKYNLNRNLLFENEMGQQTMTNNASEVLDWIPIVNPNSQ